jgi:hypothetical protein
MATKTGDVANYLEKPSEKETTKEQMIYGGGDTLTEKEKQRKEQQDKMLNEN